MLEDEENDDVLGRLMDGNWRLEMPKVHADGSDTRKRLRTGHHNKSSYGPLQERVPASL
jgi:hypothetical protein